MSNKERGINIQKFSTLKLAVKCPPYVSFFYVLLGYNVRAAWSKIFRIFVGQAFDLGDCDVMQKPRV